MNLDGSKIKKACLQDKGGCGIQHKRKIVYLMHFLTFYARVLVTRGLMEILVFKIHERFNTLNSIKKNKNYIFKNKIEDYFVTV